MRLVRSKEEIDISHEGMSFAPVYSHQIFERETITGYKDLSVVMLMNASTMQTCFTIEYSDKLADADDIVQILSQHMDSSSIVSMDNFKQVMFCCLLSVFAR